MECLPRGLQPTAIQPLMVGPGAPRGQRGEAVLWRSGYFGFPTASGSTRVESRAPKVWRGPSLTPRPSPGPGRSRGWIWARKGVSN